ncbi:Conserved_hypothetical protein [Hexamita inflata]|uniref:Uncharacterized protein n=1 Tax=Hexamita inflata TaxID=28002 RepID=A0AA86QHJ2_9EUKA|nr:Conserved hypothetical protein [Hexamita inflata]
MNLDPEIKQAVNDMDNIDLATFLQEVAGTDTRILNETTAQTAPLGDAVFDKQMKKVAAKTVKSDLKKYKALTQVQLKANMLVDFAPEKLKDAPIQEDVVDSFLKKAKIIAEPMKKKEKIVKNFNEEESSESDVPLPDINEIILNSSQIKTQKTEMLRLRAILLTNEQKLRNWAKIKSRKFRKIHNREVRQKKMNELTQKLNQVGQVGQVLGLDEYCQDLIQNQIQQNQAQLQANDDLAIKTGEVQDNGERKGVMSLKFMKNYLDKQEQMIQEDSDEIQNGELVKKVKLNQKQNYMTTKIYQKEDTRYEDNPFLDGIEDSNDDKNLKTSDAAAEKAREAVKNIQKRLDEQKKQKQEEEDQKHNYDPEAKYKKYIEQQQINKVDTAQAFIDDEIQNMKESEINKNVDGKIQDVIPGWGSWAGDGISEKEQQKLSFKQQVIKQAKINEYLKQEKERTDSGKVWMYKNQMSVNTEAQKKYNAKGINVSDEEYARYLKQSITPEFQSVTGFKYITQQERNLPRGLVVHQQKEMEGNVRELQKIQKQLEDQKVYIKGQKINTQTRKAKF